MHILFVPADASPKSVDSKNTHQCRRGWGRLSFGCLDASNNTSPPTQVATFDKIYDGLDLIARARTGTGKTLGFALPVHERIIAMRDDGTLDCKARGRTPSCIIMVPTRELCMQVTRVIVEDIVSPLSVVSVFGGAPIGPQCAAMRDGVDIVVGTPGRIIDHIDRGTLKLKDVILPCIANALGS